MDDRRRRTVFNFFEVGYSTVLILLLMDDRRRPYSL